MGVQRECLEGSGVILHVSWTLASPEIRLKWDLSGTRVLCWHNMHGQILVSLGSGGHSEVAVRRQKTDGCRWPKFLKNLVKGKDTNDKK